MAEKALKSRPAHRGQVTKLCKKADEILISDEPLTRANRDILMATIESVKSKLAHLEKLDNEITDSFLDDEEKFQNTLVEADDYAIEIREHLTKYQNFLSDQTTSSLDMSISSGSSTTSDSTRSKIKKVNLPKLSLTPFSGDILQWQSFKDGFDAAVHNDSNLDDIQRFQYLRAHLKDEAARTIEGLSLTNSNYSHALDLLKKRYGQPQKIISAYMKALWKLEMPSGTLASLITFHDTLESYIRGLNALGKSDDTFGDLLVPIILEKLPGNIRRQISRDKGDEEWTLSNLRKALQREIDANQAGEIAPDVTGYQTDIPATAAFLTTARQKRQPKMLKCAFCKNAHKSSECQVIRDKEKRIEIVKRDKLCFNCFGHHRVTDCTSKFKCQVCKRRHHTAICREPENANAKPTESKENVQGLSCVASDAAVNHVNPHAPVLLKTAVTDIVSKGSTTTATLLFDDGSQRSFITEGTAMKLGLNLNDSDSEIINVSTLGANSTGLQSMKVATFAVLTPNGSNVDIRALIVPRITTPLRNYVNPSVTNLPHLKGLKFAHPASNDDTFEISVLVGADYYYSFVGDHTVRGKGPTAISSKLGYLLSGPIPAQTISNSASVLHIAAHSNEDAKLQKFWDIESIGITDELKPKETTYDDYIETHLRMEDNRYIAKLPWRQDHAPLPTNFAVCEKRTRAMVRRLTPELRNVYDRIIKDQLNREFIEKLSEDNTAIGHYIPHHPVKKNSETTPIRIVYDCSCKSGNNPSLNDCLETGPPLLNDLASIMLRFRTHKYAVSADIEKAFLHVGLDESDREFTKFLWISDPSDPDSTFDVYQFKVVLFGAVCSPFILNATVKCHLDNNDSEVARDMKRNIYVDNILSGCDTDLDTVHYYTESNALMKSSGFTLREWSTNCQQLQEIAKKDDILNTETTVNVLGLRWDTCADALTYPNKGSPAPDGLVTKRECVRITASLYDPLGYVSPVHVNSKIFIQKLWKEKLQWDEPLPPNLRGEWIDLQQQLFDVTATSVPRPYFSSMDNQASFELHVFADASIKAYGAVVYLRHRNAQETTIVMSKSRVTPVKTMTIPRAELMAALLGSRLVQFVHTSLKDQLNITSCILWSDSQIVLHWLRSDKKLPCFVQNRVNEIRGCDVISDYKYCNTSDNPADLISRGISATNLDNSHLWCHGPRWLKQGDWPICEVFDSKIFILLQIAEQTESEISVNKVTCEPSTPPCGIDNIIDSNQYNSLKKLLRITAYVLRFVENVKTSHQNRKNGELTVAEITQAERSWLRNVQSRTYSAEIEALRAKEKSIGPLARQLRLFIDNDGLLHVGGRLHNAPLDYQSKFPILLPPKNRISELIVLDAHHNVQHSGLNSTITHIRQRIWITQIRPLVRSLLKNCVVCKRINGKPYRKPIPAPLQASRLREAPPFTVTGVDFTGALLVKTGPSQQHKAYICLFTCAVTRAIHLEMVMDLTTETFLRAFRRFAARRSLPSKMLSDNGSTYLSAANELEKLFNSPRVQTYLTNRRVQWSFIPKRAAWFGGFWERLIGVTKTALKKVLGRAYVSPDELQTILTEIEAAINDRPITCFSVDPDDLPPLTPSHLLHGRLITTLPHYNVDDEELKDPTFTLLSQDNLQKRSEFLAKVQSDFWKRWSQEYLCALREQDRLSGKGALQNHIRVGDIVLVEDSSVPRIKWRLALVQKLHPGNDGLVRSADIKTCAGKTNRPIAKLYPLEVNAGGQQVENSDSQDVVTADNDTQRINRPSRTAAVKARQKLKDWSVILS